MNVTLEINGNKFLISARQASTLQTLIDANKGGFASVKGYVSTSNRVKPEVSDIQFVSRFSYERLNARKRAALESLTYADVANEVASNPKLSALTAAEAKAQFEECKAKEIESIDKTASGDRDDSYRAGHDRCYGFIGDGIKVHYLTEKVAGKMQPVLVDGLPIVESIMVPMIEVGRKVVTEGEYKVVNSGPKVLMDNIIRRHMPKSTKYTTLSLKEDNFDSLAIAGEEILPKDIAGDFT